MNVAQGSLEEACYYLDSGRRSGIYGQCCIAGKCRKYLASWSGTLTCSFQLAPSGFWLLASGFPFLASVFRFPHNVPSRSDLSLFPNKRIPIDSIRLAEHASAGDGARESTECFRSVLIAGTNGKGSVAAFLSAMMPEAGLYISPHLTRLNERIRIGDREISDQDLKTVFAGLSNARRVRRSDPRDARNSGRLPRRCLPPSLGLAVARRRAPAGRNARGAMGDATTRLRQSTTPWPSGEARACKARYGGSSPPGVFSDNNEKGGRR